MILFLLMSYVYIAKIQQKIEKSERFGAKTLRMTELGWQNRVVEKTAKARNKPF